MMNMRVSFGLLAAGAAFLTLQCGSFPDTCRGEECGPSGVDGSPEGGDTGGPDARKPPPDCDDQADVKDAPKCVVNSFGVFADSVGGADGNPGTKELPVQTVGAALRKLDGKARVYLCGGTYPEAVTLTSSISLYGGFTCPGGVWTHTGAKATLAPTLRGYALTVAKASLPMVVSDLELVAQAAMEPGESSVTAFLSESVAVTLRRVTANAGKGKDADNAGAPASNLFSETMADLDGFGAGAGAAGGGPKVCACKSYGTSTGGKGGNGGNPATGGDPGSATPAPAAMGGRDGAGGAGYPNGGAFACSSGKPGADGSARLGGKGAETLGTLDASGWTPGAGAPGEAAARNVASRFAFRSGLSSRPLHAVNWPYLPGEHFDVHLSSYSRGRHRLWTADRGLSNGLRPRRRRW